MAHPPAGKDRDIDAMENPANETGPLTVVVTWRVRKGREREFEAWRHEIADAALKFPGHMGVNVILPSGAETGVCGDLPIRYVRAPACLAGVGHPSGAAEKGRTVQGDSTIIPSGERPGVLVFAAWVPTSPPRWKMALVTVLGVWPASMLVSWLLTPLIRGLPSALQGTPVSCRHSNSAHLGDHAVTGENSQTLAVIACKGGQ